MRLFEEIRVLNDVLSDNSKIYKLTECIDPYCRSIKRHRIIRRAMIQLHGMDYRVDLASLAGYLSDHLLLNAAGGCRYLSYIADFNRSRETGAENPVAAPDSVLVDHVKVEFPTVS
jgi:replicative DNA helicase